MAGDSDIRWHIKDIALAHSILKEQGHRGTMLSGRTCDR